MSRAAVLFAYFLAGAAGLTCEVGWARLFSTLLAGPHRAACAVAATFLCGLSLGALLGGRLADKSRSPLRLYGLFLLAAGLASLAVPSLARALEPLLGSIYRLNDGNPSHVFLISVETALIALLVFVPAALQGTALPLLTRALSRDAGEASAWVGSLYAVGGLGAAAGAWTGAAVIVPWLGVSGACLAAAALEVLAGLWIYWRGSAILSSAPAPAPGTGVGTAVALAGASPPRSHAAAPAALTEARHEVPAKVLAEVPPATPRLVFAAFAVAGGVQMLLELGWMRLAILSLGNTAAAFGTAAGLMILGLALGSLLGTVFVERLRRPQAALGWLLAAAAVTACATLPALGAMQIEFARWVAGRRITMSLPLFLALGAGWLGALVLPAAALLGTVYPLLARIAARAPDRLGRALGSAYALHTLGAVAGTLLPGLVLYPLFGNLWAPLYLAVLLCLGMGLTLVLLDSGSRNRRALRLAGAAAAVGLALGVTIPNRPWGVFDSPDNRQRYFSPMFLSFGPLLYYSRSRPFPTVAEMEKQYEALYEVLYYRDGAAASVGAFRYKGSDLQMIRINGEIECSSGDGILDMSAHLLAGHLPLLARAEARSALNIGLGGGLSLGAMSLYPEIKLDCLELSPEAARAARWFAEPNRGVLDNPRLSLGIGDGAKHARWTASSYDVISSQPSSLWVPGSSDLYSRELFEALRRRLTPRGVVCQWLSATRVAPDVFRVAVRTFANAFPQVSLWLVGHHVLLLGSDEPLEWDRGWIERCLASPTIAADLRPLGIDRPEAIFRYLRHDDSGVRELMGPGPENSSDHPILEYAGPDGLFGEEGNTVLRLLSEKLPALAPVRGFPSQAEIQAYRAGAVRLQELDIALSTRRSWQINVAMDLILKITAAGDPWLARNAARIIERYSVLGPKQEAKLFLERVFLTLPDPALRVIHQALEGGPTDIALLKKARREAMPGDWTAHVLLAQAALDDRDATLALQAAGEARQRGAPAHRVGQIEGCGWVLQGDMAAAERSFRQALAAAPEGTRGLIFYNLGYAREQQRDYAQAVENLRRALSEGADPIVTGVALARSLRGLGRPAEALAAAEQAAKHGESAEACYQAALALMDQGLLQAAREWMSLAAETEPDVYRKDLEALEARLR